MFGTRRVGVACCLLLVAIIFYILCWRCLFVLAQKLSENYSAAIKLSAE